MYLNYLVQQKRKEKQASQPKVSAQAIIMRWKPQPAPIPALPKPSVPAPPVTAPLLTHVLNDPTTPDLVISEKEPIQISQNPYLVQGYKGGGHPQGTLEFQAANAYATIGETLNLVNSYTGTKKIPHWVRTNSLLVMPRAGIDLNAYYDGKSLRFFYYSNPSIGGTVYAVDSADIVSHECGHGILDCYRPDLWNAAFIEVGAFHESFGDFCALMHSMSHNEMLQKALTETNGDLTKTNVISRLAEQFGRAIYRLSPNGRNSDYLRSAINNFKYVNPNSLPTDGPDSQLTSEVHNFSRVFTGALWDIFVMIYQANLTNGLIALEAAKNARDILCKYVILAIQNAPLIANFYQSMAKTILWADANLNSNLYHDRIQTIFVDRQIITLQARMLSATKCSNSNHITKKQNLMKIKLDDFVVRSQSQNSNPLYGVELTVPQDEVHLYNKDGFMMDHITCSTEETIKAAQDLVDNLHNTQNYGPDNTTAWTIQKGKLLRTRTCCY